MYGYTVHTGSTEKFSKGWDSIFNTPASPTKKVAPAVKKGPPTGKKTSKKS